MSIAHTALCKPHVLRPTCIACRAFSTPWNPCEIELCVCLCIVECACMNQQNVLCTLCSKWRAIARRGKGKEIQWYEKASQRLTMDLHKVIIQIYLLLIPNFSILRKKEIWHTLNIGLRLVLLNDPSVHPKHMVIFIQPVLEMILWSRCSFRSIRPNSGWWWSQWKIILFSNFKIISKNGEIFPFVGIIFHM